MAEAPQTSAEAADDLYDKRHSYDGEVKPVDAHTGRFFGTETLVDAGEREKKDARHVAITRKGTSVEVSIGSSKPVVLDGEGVKNAARVFGELALEF